MVTAPQLPIPLEALENHVAFLGKTGSGKTTGAKVIVEDLLDRGERVCVIDPTDVWFGLRLMADGKAASPYGVAIFGGAHADIGFAEHHGEAIAETIGTSSTPAIISTRLMTVGARTRFFAAFA